MAMMRPSFQAFTQKDIVQQIYLGIDFGTSYTKVSYSYAPTNVPQIQTIKWNGDFFKQTVLYIQNDKLYFDKPNGNYQEVKYFKYSIVESELKNNSQITKNNFEQMCCVYFLAQVIKRSLIVIKNDLHIQNMETIKVSVNMGVPLENFYDEVNKNNKGLYLDILEDAVLLAGGCAVKATIPENQVLISNLDNVYTEILKKKARVLWNVNVYPELAAELMLYHQSKFVPDGVYSIIDVGGGTVDIALFQKKKGTLESSSYMYCLGQKVLPYGVEILQKTPHKVSENNYKKTFSEMIINSKNYMDVHYHDYKKLDVFFLGGGSTNNWYTNYISQVKLLYGNEYKYGIPPLTFARSIEEFIESDETLLQKNQRLIISQMLARHKDDIENVKGFPDFYIAQKNESIEEDKFDFDSYLSERGDKYRD